MSEPRKVGIVDYGAGNIASLSGALKRLGYRVVISDNRSDLAAMETLILPGVGSAASAMKMLRKNGLDDVITEKYQEGTSRIIGICLGMQLFFDHSEEGDTECLGLVPGRTSLFPGRECHVGWNIVTGSGTAASEPDRAYYFNHSFYVETSDEYVTGKTHYLGDIAATVTSKNFVGVQFHPEKSQTVGQLLLRNLVEG